jgi:hypothetical protein
MPFQLPACQNARQNAKKNAPWTGPSHIRVIAGLFSDYFRRVSSRFNALFSVPGGHGASFSVAGGVLRKQPERAGKALSTRRPGIGRDGHEQAAGELSRAVAWRA